MASSCSCSRCNTRFLWMQGKMQSTVVTKSMAPGSLTNCTLVYQGCGPKEAARFDLLVMLSHLMLTHSGSTTASSTSMKSCITCCLFCHLMAHLQPQLELLHLPAALKNYFSHLTGRNYGIQTHLGILKLQAAPTPEVAAAAAACARERDSIAGLCLLARM